MKNLSVTAMAIFGVLNIGNAVAADPAPAPVAEKAAT